MTLADMDHKAFDLAIDTLLNARRVYVIGDQKLRSVSIIFRILLKSCL